MKKIKRYGKWIAASISLLSIFYYFLLPSKIFEDSYSTVLEDRTGNLLSAAIAPDGQWRFPESGSVPAKFEDAIILFEDKRFYHHPGVDLRALARAVHQNIKAGKVVSGGSTLTMQVIRLSRKNKGRTFLEKFFEMVLATRLEWRYSKKEILSLYAAHAPFGGNVVGMEAACWRYFGRKPDQLSWAEAALLAVLPNNPALIHPGKNREQLKAKRDRLLKRLHEAGKMDALTLELAVSESIPVNPVQLPRLAQHLLDRVAKDGSAGHKVVSTVEAALQQRVQQIVNDHHQRLKVNLVFNAAAIVVEVKTGNVLAYIGNSDAGPGNNSNVDMVMAPRSTGSILKPFLFAAMLDEGKMLQHSLVADVPTFINGFSPKNFSKEYDGAVPASQALIRSLNIPAVLELREYRYEKFYNLMKQMGLTTLTYPADHYGLSLILGGAEGKLWDITGAYASLARTVNHYFERPGKNRYNKNDFHPLSYLPVQPPALISESDEASSYLSAASVYLTFEALKDLYRPGEGSGWKHFSSSKKIAWKTGTSYGFRDAWAVGVNPNYAVGVWVGNSDGEGRPGLTGTEMAAPILFEIFSALPGNTWFGKPTSELKTIAVCVNSGFRATPLCEKTDTIEVVQAGLKTTACPYHKVVHLSADRKFRIHSACESLAQSIMENRFVLPPVQEYYYKEKNLSYKPLPPLRQDCENPSALASMDLIYPKSGSKIFVPRELSGNLGNTVFEAAHRNAATTIYWHLDGTFIGATRNAHRMSLAPTAGNHILTLVDDRGETLQRSFRIVSGG